MVSLIGWPWTSGECGGTGPLAHEACWAAIQRCWSLSSQAGRWWAPSGRSEAGAWRSNRVGWLLSFITLCLLKSTGSRRAGWRRCGRSVSRAWIRRGVVSALPGYRRCGRRGPSTRGRVGRTAGADRNPVVLVGVVGVGADDHAEQGVAVASDDHAGAQFRGGVAFGQDVVPDDLAGIGLAVHVGGVDDRACMLLGRGGDGDGLGPGGGVGGLVQAEVGA